MIINEQRDKIGLLITQVTKVLKSRFIFVELKTLCTFIKFRSVSSLKACKCLN